MGLYMGLCQNGCIPSNGSWHPRFDRLKSHGHPHRTMHDMAFPLQGFHLVDIADIVHPHPCFRLGSHLLLSTPCPGVLPTTDPALKGTSFWTGFPRNRPKKKGTNLANLPDSGVEWPSSSCSFRTTGTSSSTRPLVLELGGHHLHGDSEIGVRQPPFLEWLQRATKTETTHFKGCLSVRPTHMGQLASKWDLGHQCHEASQNRGCLQWSEQPFRWGW